MNEKSEESYEEKKNAESQSGKKSEKLIDERKSEAGSYENEKSKDSDEG